MERNACQRQNIPLFQYFPRFCHIFDLARIHQMTKDCHTGRFLPPGTSPPVADCRQHRAGQKVAGASAARQHLACGRHRISGEPVRQARNPGFAHGRGGPTARKRPSACPSASPSHPLASRERYGRVRVIVSGVLFQRPPALSPGAVCEEPSRAIKSLYELIYARCDRLTLRSKTTLHESN